MTLARALVGGDPAQWTITPANAGEVFVRLRLVQSIMESVEGTLKQLAEIQPLELPDGTRYGKFAEHHYTVTSPEKVLEVLGGVYGDDIAKLAQKVTVTKAGIERAVKAGLEKNGEKGPVAPVVRDALDTILELGGAQMVDVYKFKEVKNAKALSAETQPASRTYSFSELAERWDVTHEGIRHMARRGAIKAFRVGKFARVTQAEVDRIESEQWQPKPRKP